MVHARSFIAAVLGAYLLPSVSAWGFPYGSEKVRGVNLGGWLVLEVRLSPVRTRPFVNSGIAVDNAIHLR